MTNKKFKVAAMSMALTACVAAQPLLANAADDAESTPLNSTPEQSQDHVSAPSGESSASAQSQQEEVKNPQSDGAVSTIGGEDITVDYDKRETTTNEDGSSTTNSDGTVNREVPKETPPEERVANEDGGDQKNEKSTDTEGNEDGSTDTEGGKDKQDSSDGKGTDSGTEKKPIGTAEKTETETKDSELILGDKTTTTNTTQNTDGSTTTTTTTTTDATLETTTTVTGKADATTDEPLPEEKLDEGTLKDEIGKDELGNDLNWNTEIDAKFGDYTVTEVGEEKDGKKQFILSKEEKEPGEMPGEMTGEDIAKLIEAGYKKNDDGTYTLTREYTDSKGQKQTTTITVDSSKATKTTTTTLTVTLESQEHDTPKEDFGDESKEYDGISDEITIKGDNNKEYKFNLKDLLDNLKNVEPNPDGTYTYKDSEKNWTYTVTRKEHSEELANLSDKDDTELSELLNKRTGGTSYSVNENKELCYTTDKGEKCVVNKTQNTLLRSFLELSITITDHQGKESDTTKVEGSDKKPEDAKADAKKEAQEKALRDALAKAIKESAKCDISPDDIDLSKAKDGKFKFEWTDETTNTTYTYTFTYTENGSVSSSESTSKDGASAAEKNTENATAEVTGSTVIWTEEGKTASGVISGTLGDISSDFTAPEGATVTEQTADKLVYTYNGKTYEISYSAPTDAQKEEIKKQLNAKGMTAEEIDAALKSDNLKWVSWTVTETKQDTITGSSDLWQDSNGQDSNSWKYDEKNKTLTITVNGEKTTYEGVTYDKSTGTYTSGSYEIKETPGAPLDPPAIEKMLKDRFGSDLTNVTVVGSLDAAGNTTVTYEQGGKTYTLTFKNEGKSTLSVTKKEEIKLAEATKEEALKKIQQELEKLGANESLTLGDITITRENSEYVVDNSKKTLEEIVKILDPLVSNFVDYNDLSAAEIKELLKKQYQEAKDNKDTTGRNFRSDHADLTISTKLTDKDGNVIDENAIIVGASTGKAPELRHSNNVDTVVNKGGTLSNIKSNVTFDNGRAEYEHYMGQQQGQGLSGDENYYYLTGKVVYGRYDTYQSKEAAQKAANGKIVVTIGSGRNAVYRVYENQADLSAYGYMSNSANGCKRGGYDLSINHLTYVNGKVVAQTKESYSATLTKKSTATNSFGLLQLGTLSHTEKSNGTGYKDSYDLTHSENLNTRTTGTGSSSYTTYKEYEDTTTNAWEKTLEKITGIFQGKYTSTKDATVAEAIKETQVHTESEVKYHYSYVESEKLDPIVETRTVTTTPDDENVPDIPVPPTSPELPPVQDARPDEVVDTVILPADPELPPVQDARMDAALPQTGVNWLTAIGMALSGMTLMAAGAFTSLTGKKAKH